MNNQDKLQGYIGTYTKGESEGIYKFELNLKTGKIENVTLAGKAANPTYLVVDEEKGRFYSVYQKGEEGGVASFEIEGDTRDLELINYQVTKGNPPCHVSIDNKGKLLFSANYHRGTVDIYPIDFDGRLNPSSASIAHEGSGPNKKRQEKPHVHYVTLTPDEKYLCAVDLGIDELAVYNLNNGDLVKLEELSFKLKPGCGPRHMDFHPNGKFAYLFTELSAEVVVLEYSSEYPNFKILQYIETLPGEFSGENLGSAIHVSPDGNFVYVSNRGHDSITALKVDNSSGMLELVSHTSTGGMHPRDFAIDPTGSFIIAANMDSNNIVPFIRDGKTGKLSQCGEAFFVPNPVCIKFMK